MRLSLKTLLAGLFGILAVIAVGQGILAIVALNRIDAAVHDVTGNWLPSVDALSNLRGSISSTRTQQYRYLTATSDAERAQVLRDIDDNAQAVGKARKVYEPLISDDAERRLYDDFSQSWDAMHKAWLAVLATAEAGRSAEAIVLFRNEARKPYVAMNEAIAKDAAFNRDGALASAAVIRSAQDGARMTTLVALVAVIAAALGAIAFGFLGIARPIDRMTRAMRALAGGDATVAVPGAGRHDEIGAMAGALQVFKDNLVRTRALEEETALARAGAEAQRRAAMLELADGFERAVGSVLGMVGSAAAQLQGTAQAMSATAGETASQSTTVAAAAEEAASNVGTVAAAAEELGSSVQEIGRQVSGSA
ncbi:MCP four helix bundle domain-containing protein, partial [Methylobacterium sp. sgz302541]